MRYVTPEVTELLKCILDQKLPTAQGSVATSLRWGGNVIWVGYVANFIRFPAVQNFRKSVKIWHYGEFQGGNFFETQYRPYYRAQW